MDLELRAPAALPEAVTTSWRSRLCWPAQSAAPLFAQHHRNGACAREIVEGPKYVHCHESVLSLRLCFFSTQYRSAARTRIAPDILVFTFRTPSAGDLSLTLGRLPAPALASPPPLQNCRQTRPPSTRHHHAIILAPSALTLRSQWASRSDGTSSARRRRTKTS